MIFTPTLKAIHRLLYGRMPPPIAAGAERGLVLVADGVGGFDLCVTGMQYAVGWVKAPLRVGVVGWGHGPWRWYRDLTNTANHAVQAAALAAKVMDYRSQEPGQPIFLVGKSGGSAVIVQALEQLPPEAVERVILLAPALSPGYNLTRALQAMRTELVVFWSPLDLVILGAGTWLFGTADRVHTPGAGLVGFRMPPAADPTLYGKVRHVRWHPRMALRLYCGGHVGIDNPLFLSQYILPLLSAPESAPAAPSAPEPQPGVLA